MNLLKKERQAQILRLLCEGCSIRATSRLTGVHQDTISRLILRAGDHCWKVFDRTMRNLYCDSIEADELWTFVQKKERHLLPGDPLEWGSRFIYVAQDRDSRAIIGYRLGKRDDPTTDAFIEDLSQRVVSHTQISTDGWQAYRPAVRTYFNGRADFMQIIKKFAQPEDDDHRYAPTQVVGQSLVWVQGSPRRDRASTSHVERLNWTHRTFQRRRYATGSAGQRDTFKQLSRSTWLGTISPE